MKIKYLPIITRIVSKINISECFQKIKEIDFSEGASLSNLNQDDLGKIGMVLIETLVSKCNEIESDLELLIATYENKELEVIGTPGCFQQDGSHEYTNVFDGKSWTSFDYKESEGGWAGLDLGVPTQIDKIVYIPKHNLFVLYVICVYVYISQSSLEEQK